MPNPGFNPFEIIDIDGEQMPRGTQEFAELDADDVETLVVLGEPGARSGELMMKIRGILWEPIERTMIQVGEPNRDLVVDHVQRRVEPDGRLASIVYVYDLPPETAGKEPPPEWFQDTPGQGDS